MTRLSAKLNRPMQTDVSVTLTLDQRVRTRLRVMLDDGRAAGIFLGRGESLKDGDCLRDERGLVVRVNAAPERVSTVRSQDLRLLARACYHLGNRHVALPIERGRLRYLHDHVVG